MTRPKQKTEEVVYALSASSELKQKWEIICCDDEMANPDLKISCNGSIFGLEIRKIFGDEKSKGSELRKGESIRMKLQRDIVNAYYSNCALPIRVSFNCDLDNISEICKLLNEAVKGMGIWGSSKIECNGGYFIIDRIPNEFKRYCRWSNLRDSVGWVGKTNPSVIENAVIEKSKKALRYLDKYSDLRLLLVVDHTLNSGKFDIGSVEINNYGNFNQIYLFEYPGIIKTFLPT
jgi:hypothetical protein